MYVIPYVLFVVVFSCALGIASCSQRIQNYAGACLSCVYWIYPLGGAPARLICSGSRVILKSPSRLQGKSPSRLQLYLLCLRKAGFYPYSARSFMASYATSSLDGSYLE